MIVAWFFVLILTFQSVMGMGYPFAIFCVKYFINKNGGDGQMLVRHGRLRKKQADEIDRKLLKNYLTCFEAVYTALAAVNNYPIAVLNIIALEYYLHMADHMWKNGWLQNVFLMIFPLLIFLQLCITFYRWSTYLPLLRYMIIEFQTTGAGIYIYCLFNLCPFAQDVFTILT
eukprot:TRINITY_DN1377_c0_g2_i3.p3 TRINITY_DN1377_c0_g2~~TRINITY_DN1377_c0_g2_i3.p3  ORF type:complete len:172 (+),score=51.78 TRINITY_DN1377_c0_g2_i3:1690-2205(+)